MASYLIQVAYTPEALANLVKNPQNREEALRPVVEKLGGKLHGFWWAFGEYDVVLIVEAPDNATAAALSLTAMAGGGLRAAKTTPLMTPEEGLAALKKAAGAGYQPPGG